MIFMGNFVYQTHQEEAVEADRRHGEFSLLVEAEDSRHAVLLFRDKIVKTRESTEMLEGKCRIFLIQIIEFDAVPRNEPMMLGYKSIAGDPTMPFIRCTIPGANHQVCRIFDWKNDRPEIDGRDEQLFLSFDEVKDPSTDME